MLWKNIWDGPSSLGDVGGCNPGLGAKSRNLSAGLKLGHSKKHLLLQPNHWIRFYTSFSMFGNMENSGNNPELNSGEMRPSGSETLMRLFISCQGQRGGLALGCPNCPFLNNSLITATGAAAHRGRWDQMNHLGETCLHQSQHTCAKYFIFPCEPFLSLTQETRQ